MITLERFNELTQCRFSATESNIKVLEKLGDSVNDETVASYLLSDGYAKRPANGYHILREFGRYARALNGCEPRRITRTEAKTETIPAPIPAPVPEIIPAPDPAPTPEAAPEITPEAPKAESEARPELKKVLACLQAGIRPYLWGPAGTGKSHLARQAAEALRLPYYETGKIESKYDLIGFIMADGRYSEPDLYKAVRDGGIFCLDEFDSFVPEAIIAFNGLLAGGDYAPFPCGMVKIHPQFKVVATGNTNGMGPTEAYPTRQKLDESTLDRFFSIEIGYDANIEKKLANGDEDLLDFVHALRSAAKQLGVELLVSYRFIQDAVLMDGILTEKEILAGKIKFKLDEDTIESLGYNLRCAASPENRWVRAW